MNQDAVSPEHSSAAVVDLPPPTTARVGGCYREANGPSGAPVAVLLHRFLATSGLNRMQAFAPLSRHFRVIAPDLCGHGGAAREITLLRSIDWLHEIDVPTTVPVSLGDNLFPSAEQRRMAAGRGKADPSLGRGGRRRC